MASTKTIVYISEKDAIHEIIRFLTDHADVNDLAMIVSEYVRNGNVVVMDSEKFESEICCDGFVDDDEEDDDVIDPMAFEEDAMFFNQDFEMK